MLFISAYENDIHTENGEWLAGDFGESHFGTLTEALERYADVFICHSGKHGYADGFEITQEKARRILQVLRRHNLA